MKGEAASDRIDFNYFVVIHKLMIKNIGLGAVLLRLLHKMYPITAYWLHLRR